MVVIHKRQHQSDVRCVYVAANSIKWISDSGWQWVLKSMYITNSWGHTMSRNSALPIFQWYGKQINVHGWLTKRTMSGLPKIPQRSWKILWEKVITFKINLLPDNTPSHSKSFKDHFNVSVEFLHPKVTTLMQPMDQGFINTFKAQNINCTIYLVHDAVYSNDIMTTMQFWRVQCTGCINTQRIPRYKYDTDYLMHGNKTVSPSLVCSKQSINKINVSKAVVSSSPPIS